MKDFYKAFESAPYACFWLAADGTFWANDAAMQQHDGVITVDAIRDILTRQLRSGNEGALPALPTDALRINGLQTLPLEDGIFATLQDEGQSPVAAFSKEVREPLTNIFAVLPRVARHLEDEDLAYAEEIHRNCYALLRLATNLELAGRLEARPLQSRVMDLGAMVDSLCFCAASVCKERGVPIQRRVPEEPVLVKGDAALLAEAILNILRNSLQYTQDGNAIRLRLVEAAGRAVLTIEDKGLGILPEYITEIFKPYFSADPYGDSMEKPGLGLGLAVVQQTIQRMGGTVAAESRHGEGTRIVLSLPLCDDGDDILYSDPADYLLNRYSSIYIQLCGLCRLPVL